MAPLVPDIISAQFDFVIAFIVGIGFGFALEQAGFSSTRKLVGLFYGYDFTVLKVFFTAGVTAMTGVVLLAHAGLLDLSMVYVNPTFLWSAIVGGLIMGAGFIVGGFCPGTSLAGLAVGRIDAMAFTAGSFLGILAFTESYPLIEPLFMAENLGSPTIPEFFDFPPIWFAIGLTTVAIAAFFGVSKIEDYVNDAVTVIPFNTRRIYRFSAIVPFVLLGFVWIMPDADERFAGKVAQTADSDYDFEEFDADKLAFELVNQAYLFQIIDVRDSAAFKKTVPTAINIPLEKLASREWKSMIVQPYKKNLFIGDSPEMVRQAAATALLLGDKNPLICTVPVAEFRSLYLNPPAPLIAGMSKMEIDRHRFHQEAYVQLLKMEEKLKQRGAPQKKEAKKPKGGCV